MLKPLVLAFATAAAAAAIALGAGAAHAGGVSWSVAIDTPVAGTVISNAPPAYAPGYHVVDRGHEHGDERGHRGAPVPRTVPAYATGHGRAVPVVVAAHGERHALPVYLTPVAPVVYPQRWDRHHRRVIVVPAHRWRHRDRPRHDYYDHHDHHDRHDRPGRHGADRR